MANAKVIKSLNAQNYTGSYEVSGEVYKISGSLNADGQKKLNNISGSVKKGDAMVLTFNAWKNGENFRYNFNDVQDMEELSEATNAIKAAVEAVEAELAA